MPNWCSNQVTIEHDDPAQIQRLFDAFEKGEFLQAVDPMPENPPVDPAIAAEFYDSLPDWYNWRLAHWGTKWDVGGKHDGQADILTPNMLSLSFDSAWSPPMIAYQKLVNDGFKVHAYYHEMGMCFMGEFDNGEDDYIEYTCYEDIPDNWDEVWNMAEMFAMMEEDGD